MSTIKTIKQITEAVEKECLIKSQKSKTEQGKKDSLESLDKEWVVKIFKILQIRFGHKWTSYLDGVEELAVEEWSKILAGLRPENIRSGLSEWKNDWPPNPQEFRDCCEGKGLNDFGMDYTPECYRTPETRKQKLLSSTERELNRQKISSRIASLKAAIH